METLAVDLTERGWATWNLEYRRLGSGGGWPASGQDVVTAIDSVGHVTDGVGGPISIIGHSAGGHLALWAASRSRQSVAVTVGLAPVTDLELLARSGGPGSGSASRLLAAGAPPAIGGIAEQTVLIHGNEDSLVPPGHSRRVGGARLSILPGFGHFELLDPKREHWPIVIDALDGSDG
jgi:acetyl esterase/lipase